MFYLNTGTIIRKTNRMMMIIRRIKELIRSLIKSLFFIPYNVFEVVITAYVPFEAK